LRAAIQRMFRLEPEAVQNLGALDQTIIDRADAAIRKDRGLNWKIVQRGFWVHGVSDLRAYFASAELFTMQGRAELIRCPTLITQAENDSLSASASSFFDTLRCPKTLLRFTADEGADSHCEMGNRSLINRRVLDWLDQQFQ
jgi:alpha-beta hydrolase superfamily lysophospholipase